MLFARAAKPFEWLEYDAFAGPVEGRSRQYRSNAQSDSDEGVVRSLSTSRQIGDFFAAHAEGDKDEQTDALSRVIRTWRADNAASGLPVYAHGPLPKSFASVLIQLLGQESGTSVDRALSDIAASIEPDVRTSVAQQFAAQLREHGVDAPRGLSPPASESGADGRAGPGMPASPQLAPFGPGQAPQREILLSSSGDDDGYYADPKNPFPYPRRTRQGPVRERACSDAASRCVARTKLYTRERQQCGFALRQCEDLTEPDARSRMTQDNMYVVYSDGTVVVIPKHGPVYIKGGPDGPGGFRTGGRFGGDGFRTGGRF